MTLASGHGLQGAVGQLPQVRDAQRRLDNRLIPLTPLAQQALVRLPAKADQLGDGQPVRGAGILRQQGQLPGDILRRQIGDVPAIQ
ncbi:hypothetical protein D3C78_1456650 [compost metagenome]